MLKIGEFSRLTRVSVRMLHYYDDIGLLKPVQTDKFTGYRLYSVSQVVALQKIVMLRDMNFQIAEIRKALRYWSDETLKEELNRKIQEKQNHIIKEQQQIQNLRSAIESINKKQLDLHYRIIIREVPSQHVISYRKRIPDYSCEKELWNELYCFIKENHIEISRQNDNNITIFHESKETDSGVDAEVCLLVKEERTSSGPFRYRIVDGAETMACMMVRGSYVKLDKAYQAFLGWLEENPQYQWYGASRQICHRDPENEEKEEDYLTEIQIPVKLRNG